MTTGRTLPRAADNVMQLWQGFIEDHAGGTLDDLQAKLADQTEFARFSRQIIKDLGYGDQLGDDPDAPDDEDQDEADQEAQEEEQPDSTGQDESDEDQADADPEQSQEEQQDDAQAQVSMDDMADEEMGDETEMPEGEAPLEPPAPQPYSHVICVPCAIQNH